MEEELIKLNIDSIVINDCYDIEAYLKEYGETLGIHIDEKRDSIISDEKNEIQIKQYYVFCHDRFFFRFELKSNYVEKKCTAIKDGIRTQLIDKKSIEEFASNCHKHCVHIMDDRAKIERFFYKNDTYIKDEIQLKSPKKLKNIKAKIYISFNGKYILNMNVTQKFEYESLQKIIDCKELKNLRRTPWRNFLNFFKLYYNFNRMTQHPMIFLLRLIYPSK